VGAVIVIVVLQVVILGIWGTEGDPPNAVVAAAFVLFWGSVLTLLVVAVVAARRWHASRHHST
jgi:hypothetical protein